MCNGPAFRRGNNNKITTAFVASCPGRLEEQLGRPLAGESGTNVCRALRYLQERFGDALFPSLFLDDYTLMNAWPRVEYKALTHRTEACENEILAPANLAHFCQVLNKFRVVTTVCLGDRARLLCRQIEGITCYFGAHPSLQRLNTRFQSEAQTPALRREDRIQQWANSIVLEGG